MESMDVRGLLASALMRGRLRPKKSGTKLTFLCPRHADSTASAWMGDHAWGCSACGFSEPLATLAEELGVALPATAAKGLTLAEYASRKKLTHATLDAAGVVERVGKYGDPIVAMPYRDASGNTVRTKLRGPKNTWWDKDGTGTPLYGQDVLAKANVLAPVYLVEGESDCHAGWQHGLCVVGLPGASQWKSEYAALLRDRAVYVWQEPDEGGATLVASVARDLPKAKVIREVSYKGDPVKDLCDLHLRCDTTDEVLDVMHTLRSAATPIGAEGPAVVFDVIGGDTFKTLLDEKLAPIEAVPTCVPAWNMLCHGGGGGVGLARGWTVTIGANTGNGKSRMGLNLASHAVEHGETAAFLSLEMGRSELATRYMASASGEPVKALEQGSGFSRMAWDRAVAFIDDQRRRTGGQLLMNRKPLSRLSDVIACIRYYHESHGCKWFCVDYLQLAYVPNVHEINARMEMVSHQLRELSQSLGIVLVQLSQFNRVTSANRAERPVVQGLMGGSAIENDSHQVLLFDHSRVMRSGSQCDTWLLLDKNRHGGVSDIPVRWDFDTLRLLPRIAGPADHTPRAPITGPRPTPTRTRGDW